MALPGRRAQRLSFPRPGRQPIVPDLSPLRALPPLGPEESVSSHESCKGHPRGFHFPDGSPPHIFTMQPAQQRIESESSPKSYPFNGQSRSFPADYLHSLPEPAGWIPAGIQWAPQCEPDPAFPAKFLGRIEKAPTSGLLDAARYPSEWPKSREELEEVA